MGNFDLRLCAGLWMYCDGKCEKCTRYDKVIEPFIHCPYYDDNLGRTEVYV